MPSYRYLENIATADIAFEARGDTLEDLMVAAADATMNVMVDDLDSIIDRVRRPIAVQAAEPDMLLYALLEELVYRKEAERLLLRVPHVTIDERDGAYALNAEAYGEMLDPARHDLLVDVKAVTLHRFLVERTDFGWRAVVVLDI
jgi:SHS2 domain-containing protein